MNQLQKDLKKDYQVPSEYVEIYMNEFSVDKSGDYSVHRSGFMQFLRESIVDYDFFIHAALVKFKDKLFLVIGSKGCGKTSSTLYFYRNGGEIFTDEMVFFKNNKIYSVGRNLSLDEYSIEHYFPELRQLVWKRIQSKLNDVPKYMLDLKLSNNEEGFNHLDKIIVLIPQGNDKIHLSKSEKYELIERQFFVNEELDDVNLSILLDTEIEVMMISELKEKIYSEQI
ncbi:hypothetical protein [Streptococcus ruminantium]|uniref:hypothetical protein n=1 Tax=Streptococcus ruminantium TaxID=1917441 RepID=UPI0012DE71CA|nr:hypothetical protein [Streptococcus ruminantium]BDD40178.1 hypothetical protein GUT184_04420 [Streptococcus ruminantium]